MLSSYDRFILAAEELFVDPWNLDGFAERWGHLTCEDGKYLRRTAIGADWGAYTQAAAQFVLQNPDQASASQQGIDHPYISQTDELTRAIFKVHKGITYGPLLQIYHGKLNGAGAAGGIRAMHKTARLAMERGMDVVGRMHTKDEEPRIYYIREPGSAAMVSLVSADQEMPDYLVSGDQFEFSAYDLGLTRIRARVIFGEDVTDAAAQALIDEALAEVHSWHQEPNHHMGSTHIQ